MTNQRRAPSQRVLAEAAALNATLGHDNLGALSEAYGFVPSEPPLLSMPTEHRAWDEVAGQLPELFRTLRVRTVIDELPLLHAGEDHLADRYLCRASALLSILAHAYVRVQPGTPATLPASIRAPWQEVTRRLGRPRPFLSYLDLIVNNWRLRDAGRDDPLRVENLDLLIPTVGNQEERVFYLTQLEILAQCAAVIGAVARAQTAVLNEDSDTLTQELLVILERLQHVTEVSFQKIAPCPFSDTYVDPVVWAKTVAPFAVPIDEGVVGPSGTSSPIFHLLDLFFVRGGYESLLGEEALRLRGWYPQHWAHFLDAVQQVSVPDFVARAGDRRLHGLFQTVLDAYAADKGFLGVHRLKVYGYLELAFKVGRSLTIGGFQGLFQDRTWDDVDAELDQSRHERLRGYPPHCFNGLPRRLEKPSLDERAAQPVVLDIEDAGARYRPGDRCGVLPQNSDELVQKTLRVLRADGSERVTLDRVWREAIQLRHGYEDARHLPLETLLRFGKIRPVARNVARALLALTASSRLRHIINARMEDQWELWDLLAMLAAAGFDTRRLWRAEPWERESICRIVPPEDFRQYSISSAMPADEPVSARRLDLTVGALVYTTGDSRVSSPGTRYGATSHFLAGATTRLPKPAPVLSLRVVPASRFHLPADVTRPIVMLAAGAGIAPFRAFIQERARHENAGKNWLLFGTRTPEQLYYRSEIEHWIASGKLNFLVAFSAADVEARVSTVDGGTLVLEPGRRRRLNELIEEPGCARALWELMRNEADGGTGASFYICGRADFAASIHRSLKAIIARSSGITDDPTAGDYASRMIAKMTADGRLMQDVFTTYSGAYQDGVRSFDASDIVLHNNPDQGYWMVVSGRVYDVGEFMNLHPGGNRILREYAGLDATHAFQAVLHHRNTDVDALLGLYEIGVMRRLDFKANWGVAVGPGGLFYTPHEEAFRCWVRFLYLIVEMENALANDVSFLDQALTYQEDGGRRTPQKFQLLLDTHQRFLSSYLAGLTGDELQRLWAITAGLCRPDADVRTLRMRLDAVVASGEATFVRDAPAAWWRDVLQRLLEDADFIAQDALRALCDVIERHDRRLLAELKMVVREGVKVFEQQQEQAITAGGELLYDRINALSAVIARYFSDLAQALRGLDHPNSIGPTIDDVARSRDESGTTPSRFPGHGSAVGAATQRPEGRS